MICRSLGCLVALVTVGASDAPRGSPDLPAETVLLGVAPWCAPCWDELKRLDSLAAAAAPLRVRVVMMEDGSRARAMMREVPPARRWIPDPYNAVRVRSALWARTPALPYSVATDADGRVCAERGGGLTVGIVRRFVSRCAARR